MAGQGSSEVQALAERVVQLEGIVRGLVGRIQTLERHVAALEEGRPPGGGVSGSGLAKDARGSSAGASAKRAKPAGKKAA